MSIKIENVEVMGWEHAIRGMRNPMNSWEKGDSGTCESFLVNCDPEGDGCDKCPYEWDDPNCNALDYKKDFIIGHNDHKLMMSLAKGGPVHAKYRRMITVYADITAPLYWWKEFDTYRIGVEKNSCSTMHKIHEKEFELSDFSTEHLMESSDYALKYSSDELYIYDFCNVLSGAIDALNFARRHYLASKDKGWWWQMIQLLPTSYNQKRTVMLNYEVLVGMYKSRKNHKLDEWREFCKWIESLPYSEIITGELSDKEAIND